MQLRVVALLVLASSEILFAQTNSAGNSPYNQNTRTSTVRGCLAGTSGAYTLASGGTTYELVGNEELLSRVVGKEVKVAGTRPSAGEYANGSAGETGTSTTAAGAESAIKVSSVTILSDHCGSGK